MEGEARLENLRAAARGIDVGLLGAAQIRGVDPPVRVQRLGMPEGQGHPRRQRRLEPDHAHQVLAEVEQPAGQAEILDGPRIGHRGEFLYAADGRPVAGNQARGGAAPDLRGQPPRVVESGRVPAGRLEPGVPVLAHDQVGLQQRAIRHPPACVCYNRCA